MSAVHSQQGGARVPPRSGLSEQTVELGVFLLMIVPSMLLSFFAVRQQRLSFTLLATAIMFRDLALVALVTFFLWRNGEPRSRIGWSARGAGKEVILGAALFPPLSLAMAVVDRVAKALGLTAPAALPAAMLPGRTYGELVLAGLLTLVVAVAEETIFRGYLLLRLESITRSPTAAVLVSAIIFALGHGYEGPAGVATIGFAGLMFAVVYRWRRSLVAPITMHFLQDFLAIVLVPALGARHAG